MLEAQTSYPPSSMHTPDVASYRNAVPEYTLQPGIGHASTPSPLHDGEPVSLVVLDEVASPVSDDGVTVVESSVVAALVVVEAVSVSAMLDDDELAYPVDVSSSDPTSMPGPQPNAKPAAATHSAHPFIDDASLHPPHFTAPNRRQARRRSARPTSAR